MFWAITSCIDLCEAQLMCCESTGGGWMLIKNGMWSEHVQAFTLRCAREVTAGCERTLLCDDTFSQPATRTLVVHTRWFIRRTVPLRSHKQHLTLHLQICLLAALVLHSDEVVCIDEDFAAWIKEHKVLLLPASRFCTKLGKNLYTTWFS